MICTLKTNLCSQTDYDKLSIKVPYCDYDESYEFEYINNTYLPLYKCNDDIFKVVLLGSYDVLLLTTDIQDPICVLQKPDYKCNEYFYTLQLFECMSSKANYGVLVLNNLYILIDLSYDYSNYIISTDQRIKVYRLAQGMIDEWGTHRKQQKSDCMMFHYEFGRVPEFFRKLEPPFE